MSAETSAFAAAANSGATTSARRSVEMSSRSITSHFVAHARWTYRSEATPIPAECVMLRATSSSSGASSIASERNAWRKLWLSRGRELVLEGGALTRVERALRALCADEEAARRLADQRPRCGARTRSGAPCRAPAVLVDGFVRNGRCRLHGGLSTGPRQSSSTDQCSRHARVTNSAANARTRSLENDSASICSSKPPGAHQPTPSCRRWAESRQLQPVR